MKRTLILTLLSLGSLLTVADCAPPALKTHAREKCVEGGRQQMWGSSSWIGPGIESAEATNYLICKGGVWVADEDTRARVLKEEKEAADKYEKAEAHRKALYWALRTRVLTQAEEVEADNFGDSIATGSSSVRGCYGDCGAQNASYAQQEAAIQKEINDAWFSQRRLQRLARKDHSTAPVAGPCSLLTPSAPIPVGIVQTGK